MNLLERVFTTVPSRAHARRRTVGTRPRGATWTALAAALGLVLVTGVAGAAVVTVDTNSDVSDGNTSSIANLISNRGADGLISLREAMLAANNTANVAGADQIRFSIGSGLVTITPTTPLPLISNPVILDGTTQPGFAGTPLIQLDGSSSPGSTAGLDIVTDSTTVRGFIIHSWDDEGLEIDALVNGSAHHNVVQNNWIGINAAGQARPNGDNGMLVTAGTHHNQIGGTGSSDGNVVCSSVHAGILIRSPGTTDNVFEGNKVGVGPDGVTPRGNGTNGIEVITSPTDNRIGGTAAGAANIVAFNTGDGIQFVADAGNRNALLQNSVFSNGGDGIDLAGDGVTGNDASDVDAGANDLQNYPVIGMAVTNGSRVTVVGTLNSTAGTTFRLEFFSIPAGTADASSHGEARTYLGAATVTTNGAGNANFEASFVVAVPFGDLVTATATVDLGGGNYGSTSELATNVTALPSGLVVDTISDVADGATTSIAALLFNRGADARISLREAILATNASPNGATPDTIRFSIAGSGPHTIAPGSALPFVTDGVLIDGASEPDFAGAPVVELNGTGAGAGAKGLVLAAGSNGSTIRSLVVNRFLDDGLSIAATGCFVLGNRVGLDVGGTLDRGNGDDGIDVTGTGNRIGDGTVAGRNVIAGNATDGIDLEATASSTIVTGNYIGTRADGAGAIGNDANGVAVRSPSNRIGGYASGDSNLIANNGLAGVSMTAGAGPHTAILANAIHSNGSLGIDLGANGVTANDAGDGDTGPNDLLNTPVLTSVVTNAGTVTAIGTLNAAASSTYRVDLFVSAAADPSGFGEGQRYIGFTNATTDGSGNASFIATLPAGVTAGQFVTATTSEASGNTSEFGNARVVQPLALAVVKRAYRLDGTPIPTGSAVPRGERVRFLLYVNNLGGAVTDMRVQDALDPGFGYVSNSIRLDASTACCPGGCSSAQENAILAVTAAGTAGSDGSDADVVNYAAGVLRAGDVGSGNARLDVPPGRVWAVLFTVTMQ